MHTSHRNQFSQPIFEMVFRGAFRYTHLLQIDSHNNLLLFKSGKLVMKLFDKIKDVVENRSHLVCVLIDEVESIAFARSSSSKFTSTYLSLKY